MGAGGVEECLGEEGDGDEQESESMETRNKMER